MLTYVLTDKKGPLYQCLYEYMKADIKEGKLKAGEKLPSKRAFARHLGVSTITIENTYEQLMGEGYLYSLPKKGYYVSDLADFEKVRTVPKVIYPVTLPAKEENVWFDFSSNQTESAYFPFSVWAKVMRETISQREKSLLELSPCGGVWELREAIARHLASFRGMMIDPNQIVVGAGTEYLYGLLIKLLGREKTYCMENPGYKKLKRIYESHGVSCVWADLDEKGISLERLRQSKADIAHISPNHHFPTGITMPIRRRYELLAWANEEEERYIIEDDYDSEFRLNGRPIPTLQSIDVCGKVIYMNTFSKSLTSTIRISYMVLPEKLANRYYQELSFYSCTVSTFEQYALAAFISRGYFEKHINRTRLQYGKKRGQILEMIKEKLKGKACRIIENDSGLHFILEIETTVSDQELKESLLKQGIKIGSITDYDFSENKKDRHQFIINYSNMDLDSLPDALDNLAKGMRDSKGE